MKEQTNWEEQVRAVGQCTLSDSDEGYIMRGPTGEHRVAILEMGDFQRMEIHWAGFLANNGEQVAA